MYKVSVIITSYNHEKYIEIALDSVIAQRGDFSLEIIIGDDYSTDNTLSIIKLYKEKYPDLITIITTNENIGVTKNIKRCLKACSGDYIAFLEGDDYWVSDNKIEKQVAFLKNNRECAFCFNAIVLLFEEKNEEKNHPLQEKLKKENVSILTVSDLIQDNFIGNFSACLYKRSVIDLLPEDLFDIYVVDWMFNIFCAKYGNIGFIPETMSVYRIHEAGAWSKQLFKQKLMSWLEYAVIYDRYLKYEYKEDFLILKVRLLSLLIRNLPLSLLSFFVIIKYWWVSKISLFQYFRISANMVLEYYNIKLNGSKLL